MSETEKQFINIHTGSKVEKVIAKDESFHFSQIMGENNLTVYFDLPNYVDFPLGSYVEFKGETYTLMQLPVLKKINEHHYEYTLIFDSSQALLENYKIKNTLEELKFPITATPAEHLELLVHNLNQRGSGWSVGNCITSNEKLISYNHNNCREALQMIAEAFNTEWEVVGKSINLHKVEYFKGQPLALSYGKGNGFDSGVGRENSDKKSFGVLYVQGGNRNIDFSKYGSRELLLPKNQTYNYEGFSYTSDAKGKSITKSGRNTNIREESLDLSHIYPMRKGTVSTVKEKSGVYYFTDTSIPKDLDYSKYLIGGQSITVRFESGMLSGREFDATYTHKDRQFQLIAKEEDGINMPNDTFRPEQGNEYAVFNMMLPDAYICDNASKTGASWEMMKEACKFFFENQDSKFNFTGTINGIWAKKNWVNVGGKLKVGSFVSFSDTKFQPQGILIRITAIKSFINNPHSPKIELSNNLKGSNIVSEVRKLKNEEVRYERIATQSRDFTKRRWRDTQETIGQIEKSFKNFGKSINPATVSTMSAIVGDKSLQYRFVNNKQNPIEVNHNIFFDKKKKQLHSDAGIIQHLTLGIDGVKPNRPNSDFYFWDIPEFVSGSLDDADKSYYLYAKVEREGENGEFILSETPIALDSDSQYFHLLVGTLNSEYQEDRGFATMYGFTEILPGQITLTKLSSSNGQNYIKLLDDHIEINASVEFSSNSPAFNQMSDSVKSGVAEATKDIERSFSTFRDLANITIEKFKGDVIDSSEKESIKSHKELLANESADIIREYESIYNDDKLQGDAKSGLLSAKNDYQSKYNTLITAIDNAIEDDKITSSERTAVENGFTNYRDALVALRNALNVALDAIADVRISKIKIGGRNLIIKSRLLSGYISSSDGITIGGQTSYVDHYDPNFYPCNKGDEFKFSTYGETPEGDVGRAGRFYFYNSEKKMISYVVTHEGIEATGNQIKAPENTAYYRYFLTNKNLKCKLEKGTIPSEFSIAPEDVEKEIEDVNNALTTFKDVTFEAFKDGIIDKAEKEAIKSHKELLENERANIGQIYYSIYKDKNLKGKEKSTLLAIKNNYDSKYNTLISAIDNAIRDNKITSSERRAVESGFANYRDTLILFRETLNVALDAISKNKILLAEQSAEAKARELDNALKSVLKKEIQDVDTALEDYEKAVQAIADKTDFLNKTTIEGAAIATGTLMVGNETGATAGITGVKEIGKTMEESTFLWSGSNFPNRGDAATRITNGGKLYAKDAYMSGEINATNGNVGGFEIKEDRIKSGNFTTGGLSLASTGVIFRKDKNHIFAGIGSNVMPASLGIIGLQRLEYNGDETRAIGLYIKVKPKGEDFFGNSIRRALCIIGNNFQVGSSAIFETEYMGKVFSDIVKIKISRTHSYIFTSGGGNVYLPNKSEISEVTGEEPNVTFELNFIVAKNCGAVTIRGVSDGVLLDNDAIPWEGGKGSLELGEGETLKLRYHNGYYYVTSLMR